MRPLVTALFVLAVTAAASAQVQPTGAWAVRSDSPVAGFGMGSASDGVALYVFGGSVLNGGGSYVSSNALRKYDPATDRWTDLSPLPLANAYPCGAYAAGSVYSFGGTSGGTILRYVIATDQWSSLAPTLPNPVLASATALNGRIYITGGRTAVLGGSTLSDHVEFDPVTETLVSRAPVPSPLAGHAAAGIDPLRRLFVFGGTSAARQSYATATDTAYVYDATSDLWSPIAGIRSGGTSGTRTLASVFVFGSRVYLAGGVGTGVFPDTTLEYDPAANTWTDRAPSGVPRAWGAGQVVGGRGYVSGGQSTAGGISGTMAFTPPDLSPRAANVRQLGVAQGGPTNFPIRFEADIQSVVATDLFSWQIQVKAPGDTNWPPNPTLSTPPLPQGPVGVDYSNVAAGGYDWRHRFIDAIGTATPWEEFSVATPDFTFTAPPPPSPIETAVKDSSTARGNCSAGAGSSGGFLDFLVIAILARHGRSRASRPVHPARGRILG